MEKLPSRCQRYLRSARICRVRLKGGGRGGLEGDCLYRQYLETGSSSR